MLLSLLSICYFLVLRVFFTRLLCRIVLVFLLPLPPAGEDGGTTSGGIGGRGGLGLRLRVRLFLELYVGLRLGLGLGLGLRGLRGLVELRPRLIESNMASYSSIDLIPDILNGILAAVLRSLSIPAFITI